MNGSMLPLLVGIACGLVAIPIVVFLFRAVTVQVEDNEAVLVTSFGKLNRTLDRPGLHLLPPQLFPWVSLQTISLRHDFRDFREVHVNDARGTTVTVDLWLEFRITDPKRASFQVADWDRSLQNLVCHAATSILGNREFRQILCDRTELSELLRRDIIEETQRWGIEVELLLIRNVNLLPEVSRQLFESVAARLERVKADVEENGRLSVAQFEADTSVRIAGLVAEAKAQYPLAVGKALAELAATPQLLEAYRSLYALSLVRPHRTIAFSGFAADELQAVDAAMLLPALPSGGQGATDKAASLPQHAAGQQFVPPA